MLCFSRIAAFFKIANFISFSRLEVILFVLQSYIESRLHNLSCILISKASDLISLVKKRTVIFNSLFSFSTLEFPENQSVMIIPPE